LTGPEAAAGGRKYWWRSKTAALVVAVFVLPLALLAVTGGLPAVALIYAVLFVEGDLLAYLILHGRPASGKRYSGEEPPTASRAFLNADRVEGLASIVRWAKDGSDFSRKEVAQVVSRIIGHSHSVSLGEAGAWTDGRPSEPMRTVVYPYRDDPVVKVELEGLDLDRLFGGQTSPRRARAGRSRYLTDLETVVAGLEVEMNRTGGV
jgi:hypothetical protein